MKLPLTAHANVPERRERNMLGVAALSMGPEDVANQLVAALAEAGISAKSFESTRGFGDLLKEWSVLITGAVFDEVLAVEQTRVAKMSPRTQADFAKRPVECGIFIRATRKESSQPWGPSDVAIYYTIRGRALTTFRKHILRAVEIAPAAATA